MRAIDIKLLDALGATGEEERAEERLARATRLVDLGLQTAALIHELRQPLAAVKAFAQLLVESPADVALVRTRAAKIVAQATVMTELVERVHRYTRGDGVADEPGSVSVVDSVGTVVDLLRARLDKENVKVQVALEDDLPAVLTTPVALQQILVNLIGNARDAVGRGGWIRVSARNLGLEVEIVVDDDGPGVDPTLRDRLFEPFVTGKPTGSGLGLWVSRRIAEAAGGTLSLAPSEKGARFVMRLPVARANAADSSAPVAAIDVDRTTPFPVPRGDK